MPRTAAAILTVLLGRVPAGASEASADAFPWRQAGLSERQAAAHLLDRFAFGPRPGDVDRVVALGPEEWFQRQLAGDLPEPEIADRLRPLDVFGMSDLEIALTFPRPAALARAALLAGVLDEERLARLSSPGAGERSEAERRRLRRRILAWAGEQGLRPQQELVNQLQAQKVLRAAHAENQLREVLVDFWFNHFNVSLTDGQCRSHLFDYEQRAIRPHVAGRFRELLGAAARHPAMLTYLDNAQSRVDGGMPVAFEPPRSARTAARRRSLGRSADEAASRRGLNENFARELLELHTLGVDGGYDQRDVVEVARAFTGWGVVPPNKVVQMERRLGGAPRMDGTGFRLEGLFLFRADWHDAGSKSVLGRTLPAGRGMEDGEEVLDLLASHPSTARHLARKLAVRFVADEPPPALVERLAMVFESSGGELTAVLEALVRSPEFWGPAARRQKIKSPFELAMSAVRALGAEITRPQAIADWIARMGQPLYGYQAPTGFPDSAEAWVNTGALLNRMNFGLQLAAGRIRGIRLDLAQLDGGREPASADEALATYLGLLLPERPAAEVRHQLAPMIRDPELASRVQDALPPSASPEAQGEGDPSEDARMEALLRDEAEEASGQETAADSEGEVAGGAGLRAQVIGVILGSPEFQRR